MTPPGHRHSGVGDICQAPGSTSEHLRRADSGEFLIHGTGTALRPKGPMEMTGVILLGPSHKLLRGNAPHSKEVRPLLKVPLLPSVPQEDTLSSTGLCAKLWGPKRQGQGSSHIPVM